MTMSAFNTLLYRLGLSRNSIGFAALLAVGWRVSLMIFILSFGSYYYVQQSLEARVIDKLELAAEARAFRESELFRHLELAHRRSAQTLLRLLEEDGPEAISFDDLFEDFGDGSYRSKDSLWDGTVVGGNTLIDGAGAIIPNGSGLSEDRKQLLTKAMLVAAQVGNAYYPEPLSYYFFTPQSELLIRAPDREDNLRFYRKEASNDFDLSNTELFRVTSQEENPDRNFRCTSLQPLVSDVFGNTWTTGCHFPVDIDGKQIGAFGSSIRLTKLLNTSVASQLEGGDSMIISNDGKLIMHSQLTQDGKVIEGMLDILSSSNEDVKEVYANIQANAGQGQWVSFLPDFDVYIAAAEIQYLGGYFVLSYPHALIEEEAGAAALNMLYVGLVALLIALLTLTTTMKRIISDPLNKLILRTKQLALGRFEFAGHAQNQGATTAEIEALAKSTEQMASELAWIVGNLEQTVTERTKDLEAARDEAERASDAKTDFLANMSHEIRTPLTGVIGMLQLLEEEPLSQEAQANLELAQKSSNLLLSLVNDILDISRLEAGKFSVHPSDADIRAALRDTADSLTLLANQKNLTLDVIDEVKEPLWVSVDLKIVRQILINLVGNAIKFTDEGGVTIEFGTRDIDDDSICLMFAVTDTGRGMSQEESNRLFDRFERAEAAIQGEQIGAGLGLSIVKDLVALLGGDVSCLTAKGRGTRFSVTVPVTKVQAPVSGPKPKAQNRKASAPLTGIRLLAVDDNAVNRIIIEKTCSRLGATIQMFESGAKLINHLANDRGAETCDLLLLDLNMPELDGIETLRRIRSLGGRAGMLPAIALTADAIEGTEQRVRRAGMDGYATKPIDARALTDLVLELASPREEAV